MKKKLINFMISATFTLVLFCGRVEAGEAISPDRALRFGTQYHQLTYPQSIGNAGSGFGFHGAYEFVVRKRFRVDITLSYRWFPGGVALNQLGYGLLLRHYLIGDPQEAAGWHPYVGYGNQLQISTIEGRPGTASSHVTAFIGGSDFYVGKQRAYIEGGFNISYGSFFDNAATIVLSRYEVSTGIIFDW
ncbi:MAG: hypothetical protein KA715_09495 [Xanthomonadaceae bacterium]|nr:hypothetical protein [Xanthomonadaceae bacterium]